MSAEAPEEEDPEVAAARVARDAAEELVAPLLANSGPVAQVSAAPAAAAQPSVELEEAQVNKLISIVRWGKPIPEVEALINEIGITPMQAVAVRDLKTGNQVLHIAAQNGHFDLVEVITATWAADVNGQNFKGQTPLHMAAEYDFYKIVKFLLERGADRSMKNADDFEAITGIGGGKVGKEAWDSPMTILSAATDDAEFIELAFATLEAADPALLDKGNLVRVGMLKGKTCPKHWDKKRFMALVQKL